MKPNNGAIRISESVGEYRKVETVLREWGYSEKVIQQLLNERERGRRDAEAGSKPSIPVAPVLPENTQRLLPEKRDDESAIYRISTSPVGSSCVYAPVLIATNTPDHF